MVPSALRRLPARPLLRRALSALTRVDPAAVLTDADVERFSKDGAIVLRGVFQPWVEHLRAGAELNLANPGPLCDEHAAAQGTSGRFHDDQFLWRRHELFKEFVLHSGAGALAAKAMGSQTAHIFYDQLFVKEPGTPSPTPWHNDTSYWHTRGSQICSIWIALDPVPRERGLSYVKGSHRWGRWFQPKFFKQGGVDLQVQDSRFEPLPGVGHCPQDEAPERVNELVLEFASELFGPQ
jgi:ectoine hydroxylase-related dioxygenase (phytanoyl-CoA dioxygenase family)